MGNAGKVKSKNLFMTCKFCVNAEKRARLPTRYTNTDTDTDTKMERYKRQNPRQTKKELVETVSRKNEETNQLSSALK